MPTTIGVGTPAGPGRATGSFVRLLGLTVLPFAALGAQTKAIVGATVIDGNGGPPLANATLVIEGKRIAALGPRSAIQVPTGATVIDGTGRYVVPGFIDLNNHITGQGFHEDLFPLVLFGEHNPILKYGYAVEAAQMALKSGVTTIRDTYGPLPPLLEIRDLIARGEIIGPRLMVAGDILGWGGPHHEDRPLTQREKLFNEYFHAYADVGVDLTIKSPEEVRVAIDQYLDKGPDFIKYAVTTHGIDPPVHIIFSPRVQKVIVDAAHQRGLRVDVHTSSVEGMLLAAEAGADIITHAGSPGNQPVTDDVIKVLRERGTTCALFSHMTSGPLADAFLAMEKRPPRTTAARDSLVRVVWPYRQIQQRLPEYYALLEQRHDWSLQVIGERDNHIKLIKGGCRIAVATDNAPSQIPELAGERASSPFFADPGTGTILAIEGLVGLGMTPNEALVAATRNGAAAAGTLERFGTLEVGKLADLLILSANPLTDISNIRKLERVVKEGAVFDPATLPTNPKYYRR
jgi:imidazolonepropionase-like amidohydrolase